MNFTLKQLARHAVSTTKDSHVRVTGTTGCETVVKLEILPSSAANADPQSLIVSFAELGVLLRLIELALKFDANPTFYDGD